VEFGPRAAGATRAEAAARADGWLRRTGTAPFADRHPAELSGGQAQRVAIARALAAEPRMLLLDEPLSALDVSVAAELRAVLGDVLTGRTTVLVTHDALDAYLLADSVAVMHDGRVVEQGPTREVLERPRHPFTAELSGLTLVSGRRTADGMLSDEGMRLSGAVDVTVAEGARVLAAVRPSAVRIVDSGSRARAGSSAVPATVTALEPQADLVRVRTDRLSALVAPAIVADCQLTVGAAVWLDVPPDAVSIYPA
jgi:molybdate transport system ATP-binding protein